MIKAGFFPAFIIFCFFIPLKLKNICQKGLTKQRVVLESCENLKKGKNMNVVKDVKQIIAEELGLLESDIQNDKTLFEDLGADSLDVVMIYFAIERKYNVVIDEFVTIDMTVGDIVKHIEAIIVNPQNIPNKSESKPQPQKPKIIQGLDKKVKEIVSVVLGGTFDESSRLVSDLGADSLDLMEICMKLETEYQIEFQDNLDNYDLTIGELIEVVNDVVRKEIRKQKVSNPSAHNNVKPQKPVESKKPESQTLRFKDYLWLLKMRRER